MNINLPAAVRYALDRLQNAGYQAVIIGGCVRDALLYKPPEDFDIATSATPEEVKTVFARHRTLDTGIKHGTVTLLYENKAMEITTFRLDGAYTDARRPDSVTFTRELSMDVLRRDFTVNAMAYDPTVGVIDEVNGQNDLRNRILRCVGDADARFSEDALRILRALRFAATLGFALEERTERALRARAESLTRISKERIYAELRKLIAGDSAGDVLRAYRPVFEVIFPIYAGIGAALYETACRAVDHCPPDIGLRFAAFLKPLGAENAGQALNALRSDKETVERVSALIRVFPDKMGSSVDQRRMIATLGYAVYDDYLTLKAAYGMEKSAIDALRAYAEYLNTTGACLTIRQLAISGSDLLELGFQPGPEIGKVLTFLLDQVIDGALPNERGALLGALSSWSG